MDLQLLFRSACCCQASKRQPTNLLRITMLKSHFDTVLPRRTTALVVCENALKRLMFMYKRQSPVAAIVIMKGASKEGVR